VDPDDLNRCLLLLEAVPDIRENMDKIAALSVTWEKLISEWDNIEKCFLEEVGLDWSKGKKATKTYNLMKNIIEG